METTTLKKNSQEWLVEIKQHELSRDDENPALYVGTYGKYNAGSLDGAWIDLTTFNDPWEFLSWCEEVLHCDEDDPELMFQDYMYFPESMYSESASEDDLQPIWDWMELDDDEREYVQEYWNEVDSRADIDTIRDRHVYSGDFSDYAAEIADEQMACTGDKDSWIARYFDYDAFERDLKYDYYVTDNHVFTTN